MIEERALPSQTADFDELYRMYAPAVRRLAWRRTRDAHLAEDITQETFLRAYRSWDRLDPDRPVWPWLATVATNLCHDSLRKRGRAPERLLGEADVVALPAPAEVGPEARLLAGERRRGMVEALTRLNARHRRVLLRHAIEGWRYGDVAEAEGISARTLKPLMARARQTFRQSYRDAVARGGVPALVGPLIAALARLRRFGRAGVWQARRAGELADGSMTAWAELAFGVAVVFAVATGPASTSMAAAAADAVGAAGARPAPTDALASPTKVAPVSPAAAGTRVASPAPRRAPPHAGPVNAPAPAAPGPIEVAVGRSDRAASQGMRGAARTDVAGRQEQHVLGFELDCGTRARRVACDALARLP